MRQYILLFAVFFTCAAGAQGYQAVVDHPARPASDREDDDRRKPVEVMRFSGVGSGDIVLEIGAGRGYTTELVSRIVGSDGRVYAHALSPDRVIGNRLPNVVVLPNEPSDFRARFAAAGIRPGGLDSVLAFFSLHDGYNAKENDMQDAYRAIRDVLKPGGSFVVLDNTAAPGSQVKHTADLHRIDAEYLKQEILGAGFEFVAESEVLRNPDDDLMSSWFDDIDGRPRGYQDRFAFKFRKP
jgi:predicted methyltransferase